MADIQKLYEQFSGIDTGDLGTAKKVQLYSQLGSVQPDDLQSLDDHRMYVELVQKLRQSNIEDMKLFGGNFLNTLKSLLSVGEDGVYTNHLRFLYELIQNVDDCDYADQSECKLDIQFRYEKEPGQIILTYNETGFTPGNVFAITGIAEKSKNVSPDKIEIGEKGIGFKSVFGIADKVLIQSGMFSFELYADNFTVPIPKYDNFVPVEGTRLTLEMPAQECKEIYRSIVGQYLKKEAVLNQNPILFLYKLTHLKLYFDAFRYIEFDVHRTEPERHGELLIETDSVISVDMKDHYNGIDRNINSKIGCYRYTIPITYGRTECVARYGVDTAFTERRHNLVAVFPLLPETMEGFKGVLYSFLPTQVKTTAPIILHVPYKLGGSREFVDSHHNDAWFTFTNRKLIEFLKLAYLDLAHRIRQDVIRYVPYKNNYLFETGNQKGECLRINELKGSSICNEKIFYTEPGTFENVTSIVAFGKNENIGDPDTAIKLLEDSAKLFVPSYPVDMKLYGCRVIENVDRKLFAHGLDKAEMLDDILTWLEENIPRLSYYKILDAYESDYMPINLNERHLFAIAHHGELWQAFLTKAKRKIAGDKGVVVNVLGKPDYIDSHTQAVLWEVLQNADLHKDFLAYLNHINDVYVIDNKKDFVLAASNAIVLARGNELSSFARLVKPYDSQGTFTASIEIRQVSEKLNHIDDSMSNQDYLSLLHGVRKSLKDAFGDKMYNSYVKIIAEAGSDKKRFLSELLQNADDCKYPETVTPTFKLEENGSELTTSYNECGFTKDNVRAITAIGESTKNLLLHGDSQSIGEKGVGFKSVFGVAASVEIHSNGFHFRLTDKLPTIPLICREQEMNEGTTMLFQMKEAVRSAFTIKELLQLCLCLRKLKHLEIFGHIIDIADDQYYRTVAMDGEKYTLERFRYRFVINNQEALTSRNDNGRNIDPLQTITLYIPDRGPERELEVRLYSGLPTSIKSNVPLIIDAPFELTTSRETVLHNLWNEIIRSRVYKAILKVMESKKDTGLDVFRFVGFRSQNKVASWKNFDDEYLNMFNWQEVLKNGKFLPIAGMQERRAVQDGKCVLVPDFILNLQEKEDITSYFPGYVVDTTGKTQYVPLLEAIGCERASGEAIYGFLNHRVLNNITDQQFRNGLYAYLSNNQGNVVFDGIGSKVLNLPIFPVKMYSSTNYIIYNRNIYTHSTEISRNGYYILETTIMRAGLADQILNHYGRINELTQDVLNYMYQEQLQNYILNKNEEHTPAQIAQFVLAEFNNNKVNFGRCKLVVAGLKDKIPFKMKNGSYKMGRKFLNSRGQYYAGDLIANLVVDDSFQGLAKFLEYPEIETMHHEDIDFYVDDVSDDDIEDLQCDFENYYEIMVYLINEGVISDEQIVRYSLEFGVGEGGEEDTTEEFPGRTVKNTYKLKEHIQAQWDCVNPYVEKIYIRWKPMRSISKETYTNDMYQSLTNPNKCFCQMCRKRYSKRYIERDNIEKNPAFAWEQMYLSLCLTCSKDYIYMRNNDVLWDQFISRIMDADARYDDTVEIPIGDKSITFTGTHLYEIQEIFRKEGWGDNAPRRKPVKGTSVEDEELEE